MPTQTTPPKRATRGPATARSSARSPGSGPRSTGSARQVASTSARQGKRVASATANESQRVADQAKSRSQDVARVAKSQTKAVARSASADAKELTGTIKSQATEVRAELANQTRALVDEARSRTAEQAHVQVRRAADGLSKLARSTETLASCATGDAEAFRDYLTSGAEKIHSAAERIHGLADDVEAGEFEALLDDVRGFARRRPAAFLMVAAVAGFGVGRFVRASSGGEDELDELDEPVRARPVGRRGELASAGAGIRTDRGIAL